MASEEQNRILRLIIKLKHITLAAQLAPFVYTFLYLVSLILYLFAPESLCCLLDTLFYVSPIVIIIFLVESRILELCRWHKTACLLPLIAQLPAIIDNHIAELNTDAVYVNIITIISISILLLIAAYNVFFR